MSILCDGPCRSSNDCAAGQPERGGGWTSFDGASPPCSRTGTCCQPPDAGLWEPYDGRPSRTVLRGREGEAPSRYSPGCHYALLRLLHGGIPLAELRAEQYPSRWRTCRRTRVVRPAVCPAG